MSKKQCKRILRSVLMFVLLMSMVALGQKKTTEPTLKETLEWMDNTFNGGHRGLFQQWDRQNKLAEEDTYSFTYEQCNMTITMHELEDSEQAKIMWTKSREVTFKLGDVDPSTVKVVPHSSIWMTDCTEPAEVKRNELDCSVQAEIRFSTRNESKLLNYKSDVIFQELKGTDHESRQTGTDSHSAFEMYDTAYATRFAKAFRHTVELCGGKKSSF